MMKNKINPNLLSDMEILETIREEYLEVNPEGCLDFFKKRKRSPSLPYLNKRFKLTFNQILIKAGIPEKNLKLVRKSKEEYITIITSVYTKLGHTPSVQQLKAEGYEPHALINLFGSYNNAIKEAGLTPNPYKCKVSLNQSEMLKKYKAFSNKIGKPASANDLSLSKDMIGSGAFILKFCGMNNLRRLAGFNERASGNKLKYTKESIIEVLIEEQYKLKRHLTIDEINNNERLPSSMTILKYFKTTKFFNVWAEVDRLIVQTEAVSKNVLGYNNKLEIKKAGDVGEKHVAHNLNYLNLKDYIVYNSINIRVNGRIQEIDHLVIGPNGIFHLETKSYSGQISIDKNEQWSKNNKYKYESLENPEGQIKRHEQLLNEALDSKYKIINVVVLANKNCKLSGVENTELNVIKVEKLLGFINSYEIETLIDIKERAKIKKTLDKYIELVDAQAI